MMAAHLWLASLLVVFPRRSKDLFVILLLLWLFVLLLMIINKSAEFLEKKSSKMIINVAITELSLHMEELLKR